MTSRFRPYIVGIGGATKLQSSAEKALRFALTLAEEAGADTELFDGPSIHLPMYTAETGSGRRTCGGCCMRCGGRMG